MTLAVNCLVSLAPIALPVGDIVTPVQSSFEIVKPSWQTSPVVVCWTAGSAGEALGRGLGSGVGAGLFIWKNNTTAVVSKIPVKPIRLHNNHFFSPGFLVVVGVGLIIIS